MVDAQSFPVEIKSFPLLHKKGAYDPEFYYKQSELKDIVEFARLRGVRVVPEFDMPGHTGSWGLGYPVTANCPNLVSNVNNLLLNPALPLTFEIVNAVLTEMAAIFPDQYLHLGGDEINSQCWAEDKSVLAFMKDQGMGEDFNKLWAYYEERAESIYLQLNKTLVCWEELALDNPEFKPSHDALTMVWKNSNSLLPAVQSGYKGLLSAGASTSIL